MLGPENLEVVEQKKKENRLNFGIYFFFWADLFLICQDILKRK